MDGEDDYDNYFDDDWTWNSDRKPGLRVFHFVIEAREQACRRGGSKGSNESPLKFDNGGLKYK